MRVAFRQADFEALASLWSDFYPDRYRVDADLLRQNTVDSPVFDWGASAIEREEGFTLGFVAFKRSASPMLYHGADLDTAHLAAIAFRDPTVAVDLCAYAKSVLRNRGITRITFGQDSRHFFPACPDDCPSLRSFLTVEGFEEGQPCFDLERDLSDYEPPNKCLECLGEYPGCEKHDPTKPFVRPVILEEVPRLAEFLKREFPGRWRFDTLDKIRHEDRSDFVYALYVNDQIEGFAVTQDCSNLLPLGGCVWRCDLGERWGGLGPIGISKAVRGKGLGAALLGASLMGLKLRGARRTIIDWTGLIDFYGKHGFEVSRTYRSSVLRLD